MDNRITKLFQQKNKDLLSVFYTAGFPKIDSTVSIARALQKGGADIIEIGIPFSDPVADGPTIQASNKVALDNGMSLKLLLEQVRQIRKEGVSVPLILMGYFNPVMQYGIDKFIVDANDAGVDGVIIPDMPIYEYQEKYKKLFNASNLCNTFLISPTTSDDRIRLIDDATSGFIYAVSASSTTGARGEFSHDQVEYFKRLQKMKLRNPYLIGFGISNGKAFRKAADFSSGAIVGSAFIDLLKNSENLETDTITFTQSLKGVQ
jgi:tryptophan synthase alpha chain